MTKKIVTSLLVVAMAAAMSTGAFAEEITVTVKDGIKTTEGSVDIPCVKINGEVFSANKQRSYFSEFVGIGMNDRGPWEHGVAGNTVFSKYMNPVYWHGSSAFGSIDGLVRSELVPPRETAWSMSATMAVNGNTAYWRVDQAIPVY